MKESAARWVACATLLLAAYAGEARADDSQDGVIVYSAPAKSVRIHIERDTQEQCRDDAVKSCREEVSEPDTCEVLPWFRDACGAFADAGNGSYGTGWGNDQDTATKFAIATYQEYGGEDCVSDTWARSNGAFTIK